MKLENANKIRQKVVDAIMAYFVEADEDCGMIASNSFNFPVVSDDGEEGWVEIVVKIPKEDEGYEKRDEYSLKVKQKKIRLAEQEKKKKEKIERDKKLREKRKKEKEQGA